MRVVADENIPAVEALLADQATVRRLPGREIRRGHLVDADALLVRSVTRVDAALLQGTSVKFVGTATAGTDHIDQAWLDTAGIRFVNAPGANANSVVEYVLCAIAEVDDYLERLLAGARVGIVGYGHVGKALAARLDALGIQHLAYDPWLDAGEIASLASLDDVLRCEVICLHAELTRRQPWPSYHLLDQQRLAQLQQTQLLINASRGAVVDNAALLCRLRAPGAPQVLLDVWEGEPYICADLLQQVRLGTAHIAGYSLDGKVLATRMLCKALATQNPSLAVQDMDPLSPLPLLEIAAGSGPADALRHLLAASYVIGDDDKLLREAILDIDSSAAGDNFDSLRKHYARRRELAGRKVALTAQTKSFSALVAALGCIAVTRGTEDA